MAERLKASDFTRETPDRIPLKVSLFIEKIRQMAPGAKSGFIKELCSRDPPWILRKNAEISVIYICSLPPVKS